MQPIYEFPDGFTIEEGKNRIFCTRIGSDGKKNLLLQKSYKDILHYRLAEGESIGPKRRINDLPPKWLSLIDIDKVPVNLRESFLSQLGFEEDYFKQLDLQLTLSFEKCIQNIDLQDRLLRKLLDHCDVLSLNNMRRKSIYSQREATNV